MVASDRPYWGLAKYFHKNLDIGLRRCRETMDVMCKGKEPPKHTHCHSSTKHLFPIIVALLINHHNTCNKNKVQGCTHLPIAQLGVAPLNRRAHLVNCQGSLDQCPIPPSPYCTFCIQRVPERISKQTKWIKEELGLLFKKGRILCLILFCHFFHSTHMRSLNSTSICVVKKISMQSHFF